MDSELGMGKEGDLARTAKSLKGNFPPRILCCILQEQAAARITNFSLLCS